MRNKSEVDKIIGYVHHRFNGCLLPPSPHFLSSHLRSSPHTSPPPLTNGHRLCLHTPFALLASRLCSLSRFFLFRISLFPCTRFQHAWEKSMLAHGALAGKKVTRLPSRPRFTRWVTTRAIRKSVSSRGGHQTWRSGKPCGLKQTPSDHGTPAPVGCTGSSCLRTVVMLVVAPAC